MTKLFEWLEERLERGAWFRRIYVVVATVLTWRVTEWAFGYAATSKLPGIEQAAVIGAVTLPVSVVAKFAFEGYLASRK